MDRMTADLEKADETKAREFYDSNTERFAKPEQIRASHVLLKVEPADTEETRAAKRKSIEDIRARLVAGEDFATGASEHSDCPSAANGGDLGYFGRGQMVKPFEDAAFALQLNEISPIVETRFGYHVIKVTEKTPGGMTPFEDVSMDIAQYLDGMTRQQELEKYVTALRDVATIEYADSTSQ
ncbi:MAG TPA: peptidylprolyl isomerase [Candidatus Krumholzibacterium sp.]|nr:peptidylprolyl isomerase [Candidatus Krumholzibacterium sp.]